MCKYKPFYVYVCFDFKIWNCQRMSFLNLTFWDVKRYVI